MDINLGKLWDGEGQGSLACCSSWVCRESDKTWQLNTNNRDWVKKKKKLQLPGYILGSVHILFIPLLPLCFLPYSWMRKAGGKIMTLVYLLQTPGWSNKQWGLLHFQSQKKWTCAHFPVKKIETKTMLCLINQSPVHQTVPFTFCYWASVFPRNKHYSSTFFLVPSL